jgi:hypothetical protein
MSIWDDVRVGDTIRAQRSDSSIAFPVTEIRRLRIERLDLRSSQNPPYSNPFDAFQHPQVDIDIEVLGALPGMYAIQSAGWDLVITKPNPQIPMENR